MSGKTIGFPGLKKKIEFRSIKQKILLLGALCLLLTSGVIIGFSAFFLHQTAIVSAETELTRIADYQANQVENSLYPGLYSSLVIKETLVGIHRNNLSLSRQHVQSMLKEYLMDNPEFFGTDVLYEPNAFDGKDTEYINAPGHDSTGRFIPYYTRNFSSSDSNDLILEPLKEYTIPGPGDWYLIPKERKKETIMNPLIYTV